MKKKRNIKGFIEFLVIDCNCLPQTAELHRFRLNKLFDWLDQNHLNFTAPSCRKFLYHLQQERKMKNSSIGTYVITIRRYCDFLKKDFGKDIPLPKSTQQLPETLSIKEISAIIDAPRKISPPEVKKKYHLLLSLLAQTGVRIGELLNFKVEDFDFEKNAFLIRESKTRQQRFVPVSEKMGKAIITYAKKRKKSEKDFLFTPQFNNEKKLDRKSVWLELKTRAKEIGLKKPIYPHIFRHSYITELLRKNVSVSSVQRLCGHAQLSTTMGYEHLNFDDLQLATFQHPLVQKPHDPQKELVSKLRREFKGSIIANKVITMMESQLRPI